MAQWFSKRSSSIIVKSTIQSVVTIYGKSAVTQKIAHD